MKRQDRIKIPVNILTSIKTSGIERSNAVTSSTLLYIARMPSLPFLMVRFRIFFVCDFYVRPV